VKELLNKEADGKVSYSFLEGVFIFI